MIKISDVRNMIRNRQRVVIAKKTAVLKDSIEFEKEKAQLRKLQEQKINISQTHRRTKANPRIQKIKEIISNAGTVPGPKSGTKKKKEYNPFVSQGDNNPFVSQGDNKPFWMK